MKNANVPILGFAAFSGTGKTTLLTQLIPLLQARRLRVGLIKHSHHNFEIDHPGKDSYRLRKAGASPIMMVSRYRRAIITEYPDATEPRLFDQLPYFDQSLVDIILVEGFKREQFPKIELHRPSLNKPLLFPDDDAIIAIARDGPLPRPVPIPQLDLNRPDNIVAFILDWFLNHEKRRYLC